jgi:demethylmenaquinone methyltransferase/2-methoxy-6-polyprenyl-1,4-benzoquinol methylase
MPPAGRFDAVFFGFWLSHVSPEFFDCILATVRLALKPNGRVFFVDSLLEQRRRLEIMINSTTPARFRRRLND